jgi:hypothetical protein
MSAWSKNTVFGLIVVLCLLLFTSKASAVAGQWSGNGTTVFYQDGKVAIGKDAGSATLDVAGGIGSSTDRLTMRLSTYGDRGWEFWSGMYAHTAKGDYSLTIAQPNYFGCMGCRGDLVLKPGRNTLITQGNVGIGTSTPSHKLSVNGTIRAKELIVDTGWADYVFEDGYKLASLDALRDFVATNKHLPNIPSAKQIETAGVSVGEMQRLQMEKIEELTQYILQQDVQLRSLEARLASLESELK